MGSVIICDARVIWGISRAVMSIATIITVTTISNRSPTNTSNANEANRTNHRQTGDNSLIFGSTA